MKHSYVCAQDIAIIEKMENQAQSGVVEKIAVAKEQLQSLVDENQPLINEHKNKVCTCIQNIERIENELANILPRFVDLLAKIEEGYKNVYENQTYDDVGSFEIGKTISKYNGNSKSVVIPEGVIAIENSSFEGNENIESVTFPASLRYIGKSAFAGCINLKNISFSKGIFQGHIKMIDDFAFYNTGLTIIHMPEVLKYGDCVFNSRKLAELTVDDFDSVGYQGMDRINLFKTSHRYFEVAKWFDSYEVPVQIDLSDCGLPVIDLSGYDGVDAPSKLILCTKPKFKYGKPRKLRELPRWLSRNREWRRSVVINCPSCGCEIPQKDLKRIWIKRNSYITCPKCMETIFY